MFNVDKKDLNAFSIWNSVLHTPHFARGVYTKDGMYYYSSKQKGYNDIDRRICKFNEKWERANKYFDAAIEYLKDAFILVSYLKLEFSDYKKINDDTEEKKIKLTKIAEYLDELLSRDIKKFIKYYYMQDENDRKEYKVDSHYRYHYEHKKVFWRTKYRRIC